MKLYELIEYLAANSVEIRARDGKLHVTAGHTELTEEVVSSLKEYRKEVAAYQADGLQRAGSAHTLPNLHPLSLAQRRLYFLYQYDRNATHFLLPVELGLKGRVDVKRLRRALEAVIERHEICRTTYVLSDGVPHQRYEPKRHCEVMYEDLTGVAADEQELVLAGKRRQLAGTPFDLETELPLRMHLFQLQEDELSLLLVFHHIAADEWSFLQLLRELSAAHRELPLDITAAPPRGAASYFDFAAWQNARLEQGGYQVARAYWQDQLALAEPILELPLDKRRPPVPTYTNRAVTKPLPAALRTAVAMLAGRLGVSEFACFLAFYHILLYRLTGQRDIVVGTDVTGRENGQFADVVGFFVNQLALRSRVRTDLAVVDYLRDVGASVARSMRFQEMPFEILVNDLKIERDPAYAPLFQVKFLFRRYAQDLTLFEGVKVWDRGRFAHQSPYDLTFQVLTDSVVAHYNPDLFLGVTVARWLDTYVALIEEALQAEGTDVGALLSASLKTQLAPLTRGAVKAVCGNSICSRIDGEIDRRRGHVAISTPGGSITYGELGVRLGAVAGSLRGLGVGREHKVAVYLDRSIDMVVAICAVMRVGAVLVPLDTDYPVEHISYILADSGSSVVITDRSRSSDLGDFYGIRLEMETLYGSAMPQDPRNCAEVSDEDAAYLLYTSGSTGHPKGVLISRASFANLCDWYLEFAQIGTESRVLLMIPIGFDAALKNIVAPLMRGATLVLSPPSVFDPTALLKQIDEAGVTVINSVPTALYAMLTQDQARAYRSLRNIEFYAVGGEALDLGRIKPWLRSAACRAQLANIYGPTECTDISVAFKATKQQWLAREQAPIGRPIQNAQAFIVNEDLGLCLPGVMGELLVAGSAVGMGYHQLPAATASSFVQSELCGSRAYRTGDFCRYDGDGNIIYIGRRDGQTKIRGKRVELEQVRGQLAELLPGRTISVQKYAQTGLEMLLSFVDGEEPEQGAAGILQELSRRLPRHAVPAQILFVPVIPLTAHGKVSAKALLELYETRATTIATGEPLRSFTAIEIILAATWRELLGVTVSDPHANFFSLGGDSIISIQLVAQLQQHGFPVAVADVFEHPTLQQLAEFCERSLQTNVLPPSREPLARFSMVAESDRLRLPAEVEDAYPLTALQAGMLFHCMLERDSSMYHDVFSCELTFEYDAECFVEAIRRVTAANAVLRTGFDLETYSVPLQLVYPHVEAQILQIDLSAEPRPRQDERIASHVCYIKDCGLDLRGSSLIRFSILKRGDNKIQLIIDAHHAILDGWSMATLQRQMFEYYRHLKHGVPLGDVFNTGRFRFVDYVALQIQDERDEASRAYWGDYCRLSGDGAVPAAWALRPTAVIRAVKLDPALVARLAARQRSDGVSLKTMLMVAHGHMMRLLLPHDRLSTLMTDNGRLEVPGGENITGLFLNVLPVRLNFDGQRWRGLCESIQRDEVERKPHRRYPFASIASDSRRFRADSLFTYNNFHITEEVRKCEWLQIDVDEVFEESNFKISTVIHGEESHGISMLLEVRIELAPEQIDILLLEFMRGLEHLASSYEDLIPGPGLSLQAGGSTDANEWVGDLEAPNESMQMSLPWDHPRLPMHDGTTESVALRLDADLSTALRLVASNAGVHPHAVWATGWLTLLAHLSGQTSVVTGVLTNRSTTLGLNATAIAPLHLEIEADSRVDDLLLRVDGALQEIGDSHGWPDELQPSLRGGKDKGDNNRIFRAVIVLADTEATDAAPDSLTVSENAPGFPPHLLLSIGEAANGVVGQLHYAGDLFERKTMEGAVTQLQALLGGMTHGYRRRVAELAD